MEKLTESCKALNEDLVIGLSNVGQIPWAKTHSQYSYFADFFLYTENSFSYQSLKEEIPSLIGSYELSQDTGFSYVGDSFRWPLFTSRVCFRRHSLGLPCKGCTRDNSFYLKQNDRSYIVSCKNCITVLRPCPEPSCKD